MSTESARTLATAPCHACGASCTIAEVRSGWHKGKQIVMHAMPMCDVFQREDPDAFVKQCDFQPVEAS